MKLLRQEYTGLVKCRCGKKGALLHIYGIGRGISCGKNHQCIVAADKEAINKNTIKEDFARM